MTNNLKPCPFCGSTNVGDMKGWVSITQLSIVKSGFAIFLSDFAKRYLLGKDFETLSFFLSKTNDNVLGIRFFTDNMGCLKITKRQIAACCSAMALIHDYKQYLGKYKLINSEKHADFETNLIEKEDEQGDELWLKWYLD